MQALVYQGDDDRPAGYCHQGRHRWLQVGCGQGRHSARGLLEHTCIAPQGPRRSVEYKQQVTIQCQTFGKEQVKSRTPGIGCRRPGHSGHAMYCYQALDLALVLSVEGNFGQTWHRYSTTGAGVKAQSHGHNRLAAAVIEIDQFVQFQPGHVGRLLDYLYLQRYAMAEQEATDLLTVVQQGCQALLGGGEAVILRLDVLHECIRTLPVQRAVEGLLRIL